MLLFAKLRYPIIIGGLIALSSGPFVFRYIDILYSPHSFQSFLLIGVYLTISRENIKTRMLQEELDLYPGEKENRIEFEKMLKEMNMK